MARTWQNPWTPFLVRLWRVQRGDDFYEFINPLSEDKKGWLNPAGNDRIF